MPHGQLQLRRALQHVRLLHSEAKLLVKVRTTRVTMDGRALEATQTAARVGVAVSVGVGVGAAGAGVGAGAGAGTSDAGCQCHLDVSVDAAGAVGALQIATANNCKANGKPIRGRRK